jgi:hypothetical protein
VSDAFYFDADEHTYWLGTRRLLGVSDVLRMTGITDDRFYTAEGRDRGSRIHAWTELHDHGLLDWDDVPACDRPRVEAYIRYREAHPGRIVLRETPLYCPTYLYAGTPDTVIVTVDGELEDIKTGDPARWHELQLAAYQRIYNIHAKRHGLPLATRRTRLYLTEDGDCKPRACTNPRDEAIFLSAVVVAYWQLAA